MTELRVTTEIPVKAMDGEEKGHIMLFVEAHLFLIGAIEGPVVTVLLPNGSKFKLALVNLEHAVEALRAGVGR